MWRNIKAVVEEHLSSENVARYLASYILLVDMIMMMKWLCTYWPTINKQTSLKKQQANKSYSRSSLTGNISA